MVFTCDTPPIKSQDLYKRWEICPCIITIVQWFNIVDIYPIIVFFFQGYQIVVHYLLFMKSRFHENLRCICASILGNGAIHKSCWFVVVWQTHQNYCKSFFFHDIFSFKYKTDIIQGLVTVVIWQFWWLWYNCWQW